MRFASLPKHLGHALSALLDFCYPGICVSCDATCQGKAFLCGTCLTQLERLESTPSCSACANTLTYLNAPCSYCKGKGSALLDRVVRLAAFEDPLKMIIHHIKYHGMWPLAEQMTDRLLSLESTKSLLCKTDLLIPVPLHPLRQIERGYNQATVIAARIGRAGSIRVREPVVRLRQTETQTQMHAPSRREANLHDAFALLHTTEIKDRHVVIVDDVCTSGATLRAVSRVVRNGGPASVSAIVLGFTEPRNMRK